MTIFGCRRQDADILGVDPVVGAPSTSGQFSDPRPNALLPPPPPPPPGAVPHEDVCVAVSGIVGVSVRV